jgi:signal transduction histidine kinase
LHRTVTADPRISPSSFARTPEWLSAEPAAFTDLRVRLARTLHGQAAEIAERWEDQSRSVALREGNDVTRAECAGMGVALVQSLATTLASDGATSDHAVDLGLKFGVDAFELGSSLHHMLKALDLLLAMALYSVEAAVATEGETTLGLADGVRLSRRLQHASSLLTLAATKGYTQAMSDGMRDRFRILRHDLRNPLGTIKSVLAMMDDETMPLEARSHPRFRVMAKRNARSLDDLIAARLSDVEALLPVVSHQSVSLRTIACAVRRDLRAEADARSVGILVAESRWRVTIDTVALELVLHEILLAALHESKLGDELGIEFDEVSEGQAVVQVKRLPAGPVVSDEEALVRLSALAVRMGISLETGDRLVLLVPAVAVESPLVVPDTATGLPLDAAADAPSARLGGGESRHDLGGARERDHGESSRR